MDTALKQRLIGAAVLIAVAVLLLPLLLKEPAPDNEVIDTVSMVLPTAPKDDFESRELPLAVPAMVPAEGVMGMGEAPPAPVKVDTQVQDTPPEPLPDSAIAAGDYAVNFGSYASRADADRIVAALASLQLNALVEPVKVADKQAWRVYIGPYASRADAEQARIHALTLGNNARATVVTRDAEPAPAASPRPVAAPVQAAQTKPAPAAAAERLAVTESKSAQPARPATTENKPVAQARAEAAPQPRATAPAPAAPKPAASSTGFAVQLGAFANAADAQALRDRARAAGFSAITETVRTDRGTLTRVRLGPVADRAAAERIQAQARSKLGVDGMVRTHP